MKKRLEPESAAHMFPPPNAKSAAEKIGSRPSEGRFRIQFFVQFSKRWFGKSLDERSEKKFGVYSFSRKLFEIYFVRLIGTPNQNSKNGVSTSVKHLATTQVVAEYSSS